MGLESFSRAEARRRMETHHRPPLRQQVLLKTLYEDGDDEKVALHRQAERPLCLVRREGWLLRPIYSPEGPRGVHDKSGRTSFTAMRFAYGMEPLPL